VSTIAPRTEDRRKHRETGVGERRAVDRAARPEDPDGQGRDPEPEGASHQAGEECLERGPRADERRRPAARELPRRLDVPGPDREGAGRRDDDERDRDPRNLEHARRSLHRHDASLRLVDDEPDRGGERRRGGAEPRDEGPDRPVEEPLAAEEGLPVTPVGEADLLHDAVLVLLERARLVQADRIDGQRCQPSKGRRRLAELTRQVQQLVAIGQDRLW
jgi:hypothetical protein